MRLILSILFLGFIGSLNSCSKESEASEQILKDLPPAIKEMVSEIDCESANKSCGYIMYMYELNGEYVYVSGIDYTLDNNLFCCGSAGLYYDDKGVLHNFVAGKDGKDFIASSKLIGEVWSCRQ